jgi:transposase
MNIIFDRCAGLEVHKENVGVCRITPDHNGQRRKEVRSFDMNLSGLFALSDWLRSGGVTHVAVENNGVYWNAPYHILESEFTVCVADSEPVHNAPGRRAYMSDAEWLAELLQYGMIADGFVPETPSRQLRDMVRYRRQIVEDRTREVSRVHKILTDAHLKLENANALSLPERELLNAIVNGSTPGTLFSFGPSRDVSAISRRLADQRMVLQMSLERIDELNERLHNLDEEISQLIIPQEQRVFVQERYDVIGIDDSVPRSW